METKIFVMTNKCIKVPSDEYVPLQVANREEKLGYATDGSGDNIADSKNYGILTGVYWLWKNIQCDIIGICYSNKFFVRDQKILDKSYIEKKIGEYPILVSNSLCLKKNESEEYYTVKEYIQEIFGEGRLDLYRKIINKNFPDYSHAFEYVLETVLFMDDQMWITKKIFMIDTVDGFFHFFQKWMKINV